MTKMTKRDFLNAIINGTLTEDVQAYAREAIVKLDETNAKRKLSPKQVESARMQEAFRMQVAAALTDEPQSAAQIAATLGTTANKVSAALRKIDGVTVVQFKPEGAKRKGTGYRRATGEQAEA